MFFTDDADPGDEPQIRTIKPTPGDLADMDQASAQARDHGSQILSAVTMAKVGAHEEDEQQVQYAIHQFSRVVAGLDMAAALNIISLFADRLADQHITERGGVEGLIAEYNEWLANNKGEGDNP